MGIKLVLAGLGERTRYLGITIKMALAIGIGEPGTARMGIKGPVAGLGERTRSLGIKA